MMPKLQDRRERRQPHGVDADGDRIGNIELVVGHDAGQHETDRDIEHRAYDKRSENSDRHVALRIFGFLRRRRYGVEADIGEEDHGRAADHAAQAELARPGVGRNECSPRLLAVTQCSVLTNGAAAAMNTTMMTSLIATMTLLTRAEFMDADDEQGRNAGDHDHGREH